MVLYCGAVDTDVALICKENGQFDAMYLLLYYYYGGCIYTALKQFERALFFFEVCITTPTAAVSHIMLEAYKKYQLVGLLAHGDKPKSFKAPFKDIDTKLAVYLLVWILKFSCRITSPCPSTRRRW